MGNHRADREELNRLIEEYKQIMADYMDSVFRANSVRIGAQELLAKRGFSPPHIAVVEEGDIYGDLQAIHRFWDGMVTADSTAKADFSAAQTGLSALDSALNAFTNGLGQNGENLATLNVEQLKQAIFEDKSLITSLLIKMESGEALNYAERELLYQYIQSEVLDEATIAEIKEIESMISNEGVEALQDRLNDKVLVSKEALDQEIAMLQAYLYLGNNGPNTHFGGEEEKYSAEKVRAYLSLLTQYKTAILDLEAEAKTGGVDIPFLAKVDHLSYKRNVDPHIHTFETELTLNISQYAGDMTREEFLNMEFPVLVRINESTVNYYIGGNAVNSLEAEEYAELMKERVNYTENFIGEEIQQLVLGELSKRVGGVVNIADVVTRHETGKQELDNQLTVKEAKVTAGNLGMELLISERNVYGKNQYAVEVQPTDVTYSILERWKEVKLIDPNIQYPEEAIQNQDWPTVSQNLRGSSDDSTTTIYPSLQEYIISGDIREDDTVEDLVKRNKQRHESKE
ncbi:hypothetical protein [Shouchella rhizosphaerae]|uniref:hypothetical protein n=1 Tax=Shouchella rhizosphaerae TaxID=866786 RepID=UPI00203D4602|nr:hypothetical protein [Shouchella rhizosphaerae]MCM3379709.1 hypothetical protein [Shouchella rhizosphaerae]